MTVFLKNRFVRTLLQIVIILVFAVPVLLIGIFKQPCTGYVARVA